MKKVFFLLTVVASLNAASLVANCEGTNEPTQTETNCEEGKDCADAN